MRAYAGRIPDILDPGTYLTRVLAPPPADGLVKSLRLWAKASPAVAGCRTRRLGIARSTWCAGGRRPATARPARPPPQFGKNTKIRRAYARPPGTLGNDGKIAAPQVTPPAEWGSDLWGEDVFGVGFDLDGGEAGGVPAAAEGFDQEDAGD